LLKDGGSSPRVLGYRLKDGGSSPRVLGYREGNIIKMYKKYKAWIMLYIRISDVYNVAQRFGNLSST